MSHFLKNNVQILGKKFLWHPVKLSFFYRKKYRKFFIENEKPEEDEFFHSPKNFFIENEKPEDRMTL